MKTPEEYNQENMTWGDVTALVRIAQGIAGLPIDGKFGPKTRAVVFPLPPEPSIIEGWYIGASKFQMHPSWHSGTMTPQAIVWHYTATGPGTSITMAKHRMLPFGVNNRPASWHITIDTDGSMVQMAPFHTVCWHAGGADSLPIPNLGPANYHSIGIELVGHGDVFTDKQVKSAKELARTLVKKYKIKREFAMVEHSALAPSRRKDPGPVWMQNHAADVLAYAYGAP